MIIFFYIPTGYFTRNLNLDFLITRLIFLVAKLLYNYLCPSIRFRGKRDFLSL